MLLLTAVVVPPSFTLRAAPPRMLLEEANGPEALLKLCAVTDRGQRCTDAERARIMQLVEAMEADAPPADAAMLNGNWRLLYADGSAYRSSPFFWAFRQALAGSTTPVAIPGGGVQQGDAVAGAIYAITDGIPFYNIGAVFQIISGVCGETGCEVDYEEGTAPSDGAASEDEPSDGTSDRSAFGTAATASSPSAAAGTPGSLVSRVELNVPLFGLMPAKSIMTTTSTLTEPDFAPAGSDVTGVASPIETTVGIETTEAKENTLTLPLPSFPSGTALEAVSQGSSKVRMLTTYLTDELRISRPVLSLDGAEADGGIFVYARARDAI